MSQTVKRRIKREAIPVEISPEQRKRLERPWFIYGNYGAKTTPGNHGFIQGILEHGLDLRPVRNKYNRPTPECERAVDAVLREKGSEK